MNPNVATSGQVYGIGPRLTKYTPRARDTFDICDETTPQSRIGQDEVGLRFSDIVNMAANANL